MELVRKVSQKLGLGSAIDDKTAADDDKILLEMNYKQELKRGLGAFMNFAFGFTEVSVLACISAVYGYALETGFKTSNNYYEPLMTFYQVVLL